MPVTVREPRTAAGTRAGHAHVDGLTVRTWTVRDGDDDGPAAGERGDVVLVHGLGASSATFARRGVARARDYVWIVGAQVRATLRPPAADVLAGGDRVPLVLLPGIYETWPVMGGLARALHAAGHPVHAVPALGLNHRSLTDSARLATARLDELALDGAVLVAHSKGGLIGKILLADRVGPRLGGLVAVNTPFAGSVYARWFPARSVRALAPADPDLLALGREIATHARIWSVFARVDPHVPGGSELAGAVNVRLPLDGHFRPLDDPRLHAAVLEAVAHLTTPGPASHPGQEPVVP